MNDEEANELRLTANEIIRQLYIEKRVSQIKILLIACKRSLEELGVTEQE